MLGSDPRKEKTRGLLSRPRYDGNAHEDVTCGKEGVIGVWDCVCVDACFLRPRRAGQAGSVLELGV